MLRERVFYTSVQKYLKPDERVKHTVHMWRRHHLATWYMLASGVGIFVLSIAVGVTQWGSRAALGLAASAIAAAATTEYRVLASTTTGLVLLRSSRIRQKAVGFIDRLPSGTNIEPVGSNLVITEWQVNGVTYSVMKRFQQPMVAISTS